MSRGRVERTGRRTLASTFAGTQPAENDRRYWNSLRERVHGMGISRIGRYCPTIALHYFSGDSGDSVPGAFLDFEGVFVSRRNMAIGVTRIAPDGKSIWLRIIAKFFETLIR